MQPAVLAQLSSKAGEELNEESADSLSQKAEEGGVREVARLATLGLPHAGDWLHVLPSRALGHHLRPQEAEASPARQRPGDLLGIGA